MRLLNAISAATIVAASILALPVAPVSALTLYSPSWDKQVAHTQVEKAFYRGVGVRRGYGFRRGYGYHRGYGYGGAALVGGLAVGAAVAAHHCWINSYGYRVCN